MSKQLDSKNADNSNELYTLLPNVAPIDRTKFSKKDNKYIDCALFLCGYLGVENCKQKRGVVSSELHFIANAIKWQLEGVNCENIDIDEHLHK